MHPKQGLLALILAAISAAPSHAAPPSGAAPPADAAAADTAFGFRLLNAIQKATPAGNVVLSPVSAALALSMVLNGASGETKDEMLQALSLDGRDLDAINAANAQLIKLIRTPTRDVTLSVADSLWVNRRRATLLGPITGRGCKPPMTPKSAISTSQTQMPRPGSTAGQPMRPTAGFPS